MSTNIELVQRGLAGLGYSPGKIDGLDGPKTRAAAARFGQGVKAASTPVRTVGMIYQGAARHPVREIVIHCSATRPAWYSGTSLNAQRQEIRAWHKAKGWRDIGYHWLIGRDGSVLSGRAETEIGAHVIDRNQGTIGVCLIGGHGSSENDDFAQHYTGAQRTALIQLITGISSRTQIETISGHNQYAAKACPGFNVPAWLKETL